MARRDELQGLREPRVMLRSLSTAELVGNEFEQRPSIIRRWQDSDKNTHLSVLLK